MGIPRTVRNNKEPKLAPLTCVTTPQMVPIIEPTDYDLPLPRLPTQDQMVRIQPVQATSHHTNRKQII